MLLNEGRHPVSNETVIPAEAVDHVAQGVSVMVGKAPYPEMVCQAVVQGYTAKLNLSEEPEGLRMRPVEVHIPRSRDRRT